MLRAIKRLPHPAPAQVDKCKAAAAAAKRGNIAPSAAAAGAAARATLAEQEAAAPGSSGKGKRGGSGAAGGTGGGGGATPSGRPGKTPGYNVAYVGNVAFEVSADELRGVFSECGVKLVRLHTDPNTGRSKGYAHVHFEDEAGLDRCGARASGAGGLGPSRVIACQARPSAAAPRPPASSAWCMSMPSV